jgi:dephospho-CoA kinase
VTEIPARSLVGLTGGIAAGKSEALRAFERHGAATISTDAVVHELQRSPEVVAKMVERWGDEAAPGGELDRARVAEIVFADADELKWLESEVHPLVGARIAGWIAELPDDISIAVIEVPLLFEAGMEEMFDAVVAVVADDELRNERERGRDLAALEGRAGRQLSQDEKAGRATHVIVNDGTLEDLDVRVTEIVSELSEREARGE